jgi:tRNA A37 threonylcarbamoyltransferase TsaD
MDSVEMKSFFDPVVEKIVELVRSQVAQAEHKRKNVDRIILAGGFGESQYLYETLETWAERHSISLILPAHR